MKNIVITIIFIMIAATLMAQNKSQNDTIYTLDEASISTNKRNKIEISRLEVPVQFLPMSISTVSSKDLEIRGITNIEDAVKFMPGVRMQTSYGGFQTLYVRGFSYTPIVIDGIRDERTMINSYPFPDLTSVESMELLKGPASVLYGHSVLGGVLNIVRKAPTPETTVNARMTYGSWKNKQANMDFGGKLAGPVNYRANFNYADQDGWRNNGNKRFSGYLALNAQLNASNSIDVRGAFNNDWYGTEIGLPPIMTNNIFNADGTPYLKAGEMLPGLNKEARYNSESDFFKHNGRNISAKYQKVFSEKMKLTNHISFSDDDINYFGTEELSYLTSTNAIYNHYYESSGKRTYICLDTVALTYPLRFSHIARTLSNQLELSGHFFTGSIKHNYMGGYSFTQMFRNSYSGYNLGVDVYGPGLFSHVSVRNPHSMGYMESKFSKATITKDYSHGIYFQDLIEFSEQFKVLLAGRYDMYKYLRSGADTYDGKRQYHKSEQTPYNIAENSAFTYRAGVVYLPHPSVSVFASAASYFRPDRTFASATSIYLNKDGEEFIPGTGSGTFNPEKGFQFEGGIKYSYKSILHATASIYYVRKNDVVRSLGRVQDPHVDTVSLKTVVGQVGSEESKGFDIELAFTPTNYASLHVGYGYTDVATRGITQNQWVQHDTQGLTLVPKNTFYTYGNIEIPKGILKNLAFNLSVSFMDEVDRNYTGTMKFPSYWVTDAGVSYPLKNNIKLSLNVNNIFDKGYYNQALGNQIVPGMPRNYLVSIAYSFK